MPGTSSLVGLRDAADQLGVHYMTAYRYVRTGRLPAHKEGGEWRVDPSDLARIADDAASPRPRAERRSVHRGRLERCLIAGDEAGAWDVIDAALVSGASPSEVLTAMVTPSLRSIGERWSDGELSVADEHRASAVAQRLIARLGPRFRGPGRRRGTVVLGATTGDRHSLPTAILSDLLRGRGLDVVDLGADCPASTFVDAVERAAPVCAVGICVTAPEAVGGVAAVVRELRASGVGCPVVVGGGAVRDEDDAARLGADRWAGGVEDVLELFTSLAAQ
jgi:excisionase family DNA binding protein